MPPIGCGVIRATDGNFYRQLILSSADGHL